jgi:hypothetical protein
MTVGFGVEPNLLTLMLGIKRSRADAFLCKHRRWGITPRPENADNLTQSAIKLSFKFTASCIE